MLQKSGKERFEFENEVDQGKGYGEKNSEKNYPVFLGEATGQYLGLLSTPSF